MVNSLPSKLRVALVLADLEGMKQQVADKLGITLAAVKSRILRGRSRMRRMIEDCCHLELDFRGSIMEYVPKGSCCPPCGEDVPWA
ncbi:MAG: RNA polymerase sigma-70 factor ECF [Desulfovibrionaceae bacterium]|nr:MAG: RNA polymerase sigma-70 factor ECF [Desulfovibrionaceae bacterium]